MRLTLSLGLVVVLVLAAPLHGESWEESLAIIDDHEEPLLTRGEAVGQMVDVAVRSRSVCVELARRAAYDPVGTEIFNLLTWDHPCAEKWGEEIAEDLLEELGPERFAVWDWFSCEYLRGHPEIANDVAAVEDYNATKRLGVHLQHCGLDDQKATLLAGRARPRYISYAQGGRSGLLQQISGYIERDGDRVHVFVKGTSPDLWPPTSSVYLTLGPSEQDEDCILYRGGAGYCGFLGRTIGGTVRLNTGASTLTLRDVVFRGSSCKEGAEETTIAISAEEDLELWPVRGLYDYLAVPKSAPELVPELESW